MGNSHFCQKKGKKRSSTIILLCYPEGEIPTTGVFPNRLGANFQIRTWKTATSAGRKRGRENRSFSFSIRPPHLGGKARFGKLENYTGGERSKHRN